MFPNDSLISVNKSLLKAKHNSSLGSFSNIRKKMYQQLGYFFFLSPNSKSCFFRKNLERIVSYNDLFFLFQKTFNQFFKENIFSTVFVTEEKLAMLNILRLFSQGLKKKKAVQILCLVWRKNYQHCGVAFLSSNELKKGLLK